jgi:hypothetical protein
MEPKMKQSGSVTSIVVGLLSIIASDAWATCEKSPIRYFFGDANISQSFRLKAGEPCAHDLSLLRQEDRAPMSIGAMTIVARPQHGRVGVYNSLARHGYAYNPSPGFVGSDHFSVAVDLEKGQQVSKMTIDVSVEVTQ